MKILAAQKADFLPSCTSGLQYTAMLETGELVDIYLHRRQDSDWPSWLAPFGGMHASINVSIHIPSINMIDVSHIELNKKRENQLVTLSLNNYVNRRLRIWGNKKDG